jgi:hypothetical protein
MHHPVGSFTFLFLQLWKNNIFKYMQVKLAPLWYAQKEKESVWVKTAVP